MRIAPRSAAIIEQAWRRHGLLLVAALTLIVCALSGVLRPFDHYFAALRADIVQREPSDTLVIVEIDAHSLEAGRRWPWPRERFARAIQNLDNAGADMIGFDVDFSLRSDARNDAALRAAIDREPGSIILPTFVQPGVSEANTPLADLSENAVFGGVNVDLDADGRVRRYRRGYQEGETYRALIASILAGETYGATAPFLIDYGIRADHIERISFDDIYHGRFDPEKVRGKHVLVGATALELGDEFATPTAPTMPGVDIHALAYESLVQGRTLASPAPLVSLIAALGVLFALWPRRDDVDIARLFIAQGAGLIGAFGLSVLLQAAAPVSLDIAALVFAHALCTGAGVHKEMRRRAFALVAEREANLRHAASHDPESGLPNRRAMLEAIQNAAAQTRETGQTLYAVVIGVDRFPTLRGAIGYENATLLMQRLAERAAPHAFNQTAYHIATSVLGVIGIAADEADAKTRQHAMIAALDPTVTISAQEIEASIRSGAAAAADGDQKPEKVLEHATLALDHAYAEPMRDVFYNPADAVDPKLQLAILVEAKKGLEQGEFTLLYQGKAACADRRILGAEALMRWRHPEHGDIPPDNFILVAEETGAIDDLTRWALTRAIEDQKTLRAEGVDISISVNISGRLLSDAQFCAFAIEAVKTANARIVLEVTETAIIEDGPAALSSVAAFRAAGIGISVDDYGAGLSSIAYLKQIPADELKIDKSLIRDLAASERDQVIVKSTIDLAHSLSMSVVAEGVEDEAAAETARALGADCLQGYLVSKPASLEQLIQLCKSAGQDPGRPSLRAAR